MLYLEVSRDELVRRLTGRRTCRGCGAGYHVVSAPPRTADRCDRCGGELYQREDDAEATVSRRLDVYATLTAPLVKPIAAKPFEVPPQEEWANIVNTLRYVRDHVVPYVGPVEPVSVFRNAALNRCAGGAPESVHRSMSAIDFVPLTHMPSVASPKASLVLPIASLVLPLISSLSSPIVTS